MNFIRSSSDTMTSVQAILVNAGYGQLVLRDSAGQPLQKWTLAQPKCVLGSALNCNIRCMEPGIADHHVLLVIGSRQVFLRCLGAGVTIHGAPISERIFNGDQPDFEFEISGHQFHYSRQPSSLPLAQYSPPSQADRSGNNDSPLTASAAQSSIGTVRTNSSSSNLPHTEPVDIAPKVNERLKFTFVRALEKSRQLAATANSMIEDAANTKPLWVEEIVRDALRPVESQLEELTMPLQTLEKQMRREAARKRKQRARRQQNAESKADTPDTTTQELLQSQESIQKIVADQANRLEQVDQHVTAIVSQIGTLERILAEESNQHQQIVATTNRSGEEIMRLQREMLHLVNGLESRIAEPKSADENDTKWQASIERQLDELRSSLGTLDEIKTVLQQALTQNRELTQDWETHWQKIEDATRRSIEAQAMAAQAQASLSAATAAATAAASAAQNYIPASGYQLAPSQAIAPQAALPQHSVPQHSVHSTTAGFSATACR